jgi:hypothetical protein
MVIIMLLTANLIVTAAPPNEKINKNREYVCVRWTGSPDPSQRNPSVCITWEIREKPLFKRL